MSVPYGVTVTLPGQGGMTRAGYAFEGWDIEANSPTTYLRTTISTKVSITLYAVWTANPVTLTYDANGATGRVPDPIANTPGTKIAMPDQCLLAKTGYSFGGWNTNAAGTGTNYVAGSFYTFTVATTVYAKWIPNPLTVTFSANGGSGAAPAAMSSFTGNPVYMPGQGNLSKSGNSFGGWNTNSAGTGTTYAVGAWGTFTASITLYAKWTANAPTPPTPSCPATAVCLYYGANMTGSFATYTTSVATISGTYPVAGLAGYGQAIRNNAHSITNNTSDLVTVWVNPNYAGGFQTIQAHTSVNVVSPVLNNEASIRFGTPPPNSVPVTDIRVLETGASIGTEMDLYAIQYLAQGSSIYLIAQALPLYATPPVTSWRWISSNPSIVAVTAGPMTSGGMTLEITGQGEAWITIQAFISSTLAKSVTFGIQALGPGVVPHVGTWSQSVVFSKSFVQQSDAYEQARDYLSTSANAGMFADWACEATIEIPGLGEASCAFTVTHTLETWINSAEAKEQFRLAQINHNCVALYQGLKFNPFTVPSATQFSGTYHDMVCTE